MEALVKEAGVRRRYERIGVDFDVFSMNTGKPIGRAINLSLGGVFIQAATPLMPRTKLLLEFKLPDQELPIKAYSDVKWVSRNGMASQSKLLGMGVQFIGIYEHYIDKLERFIRRELKRINSDTLSMADFINFSNKDIFEKARVFWEFIEDTKNKDYNKYETLLLSASKNRVVIFDERIRRERELIMMGTSNYLGLTSHPKVIDAAKEAILKYGTGTASIRLLSGTNTLHKKLEEKLAELKSCEDSLVFPTGHMANIGAISALLGKKDIAIIDKRVHASILDGCRLSRGSFRTFRHSDMEHLRQVLETVENKYDGKIIIAEGVDGIDGDILPLPEIVEIANEYGVKLMIDEAHATGVMGARGRGTASYYNMEGKVDVVMDSLSKAIGGLGGYIASSREVIRYLKYYATTSFFSVSSSPAMLASALAATELMESEPKLIQKLWENIKYMKEGLKIIGFNNVDKSQSAIFSTIVGNDLLLREMTKKIFEAGVFLEPLPYPTVPKGEERLRLRIMATHTREDLNQTLEILEKVGKESGILMKYPVSVTPIDEKQRIVKTIDQGKDIEVAEISSKADIVESVKFSWKVYQNYPNWVPYFLINQRVNLISGDYLYLKRNVKSKRFIVRENGKMVGTVSALVDERFLTFWNQKVGFLGFFEALPGCDAAIGFLVSTALEFLKSEGMEEVWAPINIPFVFYGGGLLSGGFDEPPSFLQPYTAPYYHDYFKQNGFNSIKRLPHHSIDLNPRENVRRIRTFARGSGITIRELDRSRYEAEALSVARVYNRSFTLLWKYTPFRGQEFVEFVRDFSDLIVQGFWQVAEVEGEIVGFVGGFPQCASIFKMVSGELGPSELPAISAEIGLIKEGAIVLLGVLDKFRDRDIGLKLLASLCANMIDKGYVRATCTWEISDKEDASKLIEKLGGKKDDLEWIIYGRYLK